MERLVRRMLSSKWLDAAEYLRGVGLSNVSYEKRLPC